MTSIEAHIVYALAWLSFGLGHSVLAGAPARHRLAPALGPYYRIAYNGFAGVHLAAIWLAGHWLLAGAAPFALPEAARTGLYGVSILGLVILLLAARGYDLGRFIGTTQIRNRRRGTTEPEDEPLHTGGFHAWVRHPLYAGVYLMLWGNAQDPFGLATAIWASAYLAVGTMFEERRLLKLYGEAYRSYRARVPAIIPWRGKAV
ncbi:MAG: isoprenylcysteine carboxylmethyltransferase family protein [Alphaproteobacteria bacterium]|nr:isoprenylcysteine carboxylmethyltransferase family protein [Alphaproteobacteria bacterium]